MESQQKIILRMELQIGQLIRLVANLNERLDIVEHEQKERELHRVVQIKRISHV
ncbi:hypothetical protein M3197_01245 [Sporosarcina aquimarina]|uniref:hypothetical protein n=1 Tax=Sporosarcina aquimarina TaxID=114975 RepID=UPI00203F61E3|nr:hypothetical protein [Sporosarcina aquimarina]MCM3756102.1 hypothetical protein [Sporosarcina aquimarina]